MAMKHDTELIRKAIVLAKKGHGGAEPNPLVGCVITNRDGKIVGEGFHKQFGEAHAEIHALTIAGDAATGGTAFVTLEPCNHTGKTPPCSQVLIDAGIRRVVIGAKDPHSEASGGVAFLRNAGVEVDVIDDDCCKKLIAPFSHRIHTGLPWVICKWAQTIDGYIETSVGESPWISSQESQQCVHQERGCVDAIVVGVGTVVADNPTLTVRNATKHRTPLRVVIDPTLRTPESANILNDDAPTLIAHAEHADTSRLHSCETLALPSENGVLDLAPLFKQLVSKYNATNVIVEGGTTLFQHIINQKLANELWVFTSPHKSKSQQFTSMNNLVQHLNTQLVSEESCGVDTAYRYTVTC